MPCRRAPESDPSAVSPFRSVWRLAVARDPVRVIGRIIPEPALWGTGAAMTLCPACGFDLDESPWTGGSRSDEICPSCGLQFGYQDLKARRERQEDAFYHGWRSCWLVHGAPWSGSGPPPVDWDPHAQVKRLLAT